MRIPAGLLLIGAACAVALPARAAPGWLDTTLLGAAETSLALDMLQTLDIQRHPGGEPVIVPGGGLRHLSPMYETNPLLGSNPSDVKIGVYFAGTMLLTGAAWYVLPERLRFLAPLAVLILEVPQIDRNARAGLSIRF